MLRVTRAKCGAARALPAWGCLRQHNLVPIHSRSSWPTAHFATSNQTSESAELRVTLAVSEEGIAHITLNNPRERNALSLGVLKELQECLKELDLRSGVRVAILKAVGPVFSAGHNVKEMRAQNGDKAYFEECFHLCSTVMQSIRKLTVPVIAQVDGLATAAGAQLVASCDMVVASEGSQFATPGVKIGLFCTTPSVAIGRALSSEKKMMEMLLTGEPVGAQEAYQFGLVNRVVPKAELELAVMELACKVAAQPRKVIALGKRAFYEQMAERNLSSAYARAEKVMTENAIAEDALEGMEAFVQKRQPQWTE